MTKHKNSEWVKIFVEGNPVQWKMAGIDGAYHSWQLVTSLSQFDDQGLMFRVKPEKVTTKGYKRYAFLEYGEWEVDTLVEGSHYVLSDTDVLIDKEWQYHMIEEV